MLTTTLVSLFERDLNRVIEELNQYQTEPNIWHIENNISNSAGNLALHLIGNLNTYIGKEIGKEIGKTNYIRNRELEFSQKDVPKQELIDQLKQTILVLQNALNSITDGDLQQEYPILVFSEKTSIEYFLVHLATH